MKSLIVDSVISILHQDPAKNRKLVLGVLSEFIEDCDTESLSCRLTWLIAIETSILFDQDKVA